ncbi:HDOD domain-containing protein [Steroidobacter sp. S1-65]|uniref:HDOD domain-containing protein n=1 Tax=Steroidobacter gossypii TaxID=2805490 RepID=A0ABS1WVD2_9GAMM|nr:response regulator [Steroidobacter gossypii]MBM0104936.1 HDOD domain-containing protein [Steroidobacter gossypii]
MKRVLFVDDERALLDGLRARLHPLRGAYDMVFVESGPRAITEIEHRGFDIIVTDVRMPVMDGAQLLAIVAERWPEIVRIVLSGYAEQDKSVRLPILAHQHLSKPCDPQQIENALSRCVQMHDLLQEPRLRAIVGGLRRVPTLPRVYSQLRTMVNGQNASVQEVARIVSADSGIAAKILQVVNSSFFRLPRRISRISDAITYLGFAAVRNLVLSEEVFSQWPREASAPGLQPEQLQASAQRLAATAHALSAGTAFADDAMLAGLLHNIGYRVLLGECPGLLTEAQASARTQSVPLHIAERQIIGASHAEIGAYLLGLWGLPHGVVDAVAFQYMPDHVEHTHFDALAAIAMAHTIVAQAGRPAGADVESNNKLLQSLHAPFDWSEAQRRADEASGDWH